MLQNVMVLKIIVLIIFPFQEKVEFKKKLIFVWRFTNENYFFKFSPYT